MQMKIKKIEMYTESNKISFSASDIKELRDEYIIIETDKEIAYNSLDDVFGIVIYKQTDKNKEEE